MWLNPSPILWKQCFIQHAIELNLLFLLYCRKPLLAGLKGKGTREMSLKTENHKNEKAFKLTWLKNKTKNWTSLSSLSLWCDTTRYSVPQETPRQLEPKNKLDLQHSVCRGHCTVPCAHNEAKLCLCDRAGVWVCMCVWHFVDLCIKCAKAFRVWVCYFCHWPALTARHYATVWFPTHRFLFHVHVPYVKLYRTPLKRMHPLSMPLKNCSTPVSKSYQVWVAFKKLNM